jgi:hypothetical protein
MDSSEEKAPSYIEDLPIWIARSSPALALPLLLLPFFPILYIADPLRAVGVALVTTVALALASRPILSPIRARVGSDGLSYEWLGREYFISFANVERIERTDGRVTLHCSDRSRIRLVNWAQKPLDPTIVDQLEQLLAEFRAIDPAVVPASIARQARRPSDWVQAVRALVNNAGSYREQGVTRQSLIAWLENPAVPADIRAVAAAALRAEMDDAERARIRVQALHTASPRLRVVLEQAVRSDGDDRDVANAVAKVKTATKR